MINTINTRLILQIAALFLIAGCSKNSSTENATNFYKISGPAQGTSYHITLETDSPELLQSAVDSLIEVIDVSMSTYRDDSYISKWNANSLTLNDAKDAHFEEVLSTSISLAEETKGYFDPTVGPLLAYFGFGEKLDQSIDEKQLPSLKAIMGIDKITLVEETHPTKSVADLTLNFNAVAQGYTVDEIAELLNEKGVTNYMIELGGEVKVAGVNKEAGQWSIGIEKPEENIELEQDLKKRLQTIILLNNGQSLATSGNYRNFKIDEVSGEKYGHIIDPISMKPVKSKLLSATVITENCAEADAIATALMAMGYEKAQAFLLENEAKYNAFLVYVDNEKGLSIWNSEKLELEAITQ